jgi:hypothetical protein
MDSLGIPDSAVSPETREAAPRAQDWSCVLSFRQCGIAVLGLLALLAITALASDRPAGWAAGKVLLPALALGLLPGFLAALMLRRAAWSMTGLLGVSIALSMGLAQVPTLIGLGLHIPTNSVALGYAAVLTAVGLALSLSKRTLACVTLGKGEGLVLVAIAAVSCLAYVKGSPFFSDEDQMHISIIRRIAAETAPAPDNIFPAEGVVYTHPYPGTHYFMALVSDLGRGDALFVFHKLRAFWTFATLLFLYVLALRIFENRVIATVSLVTGIAFVLNGCYADFLTIFWAQLAPFSHPSDVAMSVLLPGLLLVALEYYAATDRREASFFLAATMVVGAMVTITHIREAVQFLVYSACLAGVTLIFAWDATRLKRVLMVIGALVVMGGAYGVWHHFHVRHIAEFDAAAKAEMVNFLRTGTLQTLVVDPLPFHEKSVLLSLFYGWNVVVILASPLVCLAFGRKPFVLMMGASILTYLVIVRVPLLSILFTYSTHTQILLTPSRNISFFLYLITGPMLYLIVCQLSRLPLRWLGHVVAVTAALALAWVAQLGWVFWMGHYDWVFLPAIGLYLLAGIVLWLGVRESSRDVLQQTHKPEAQARGRPSLALRACMLPDHASYSWRTGVVFAIILVVAAAGSGMWDHSLLAVHHVPTYSPFLGDEAPLVRSPGNLLASLRPITTPSWELKQTNVTFADYPLTIANNTSVPPPRRLLRWAEANLPVDAILASNGLNVYPLPIFLPQRVVAWPPLVTFGLSYPRQLSPAYYEHMDRSVAKYGKQPFFNIQETLNERLEFLASTHTTHVVLDPPSYRELHGVLAQWPDWFECIYDDGEWAVFAVHLPSFGSRVSSVFRRSVFDVLLAHGPRTCSFCCEPTASG